MKRLPIYNAILENENDGITCISFVENPATEVTALYFNKNEELIFAEEDKRMITSVVMLAETPIYRRNGDYEYYVKYQKDTLIEMCQKMLKDNTFNKISFNHNGKEIPNGNIELIELYTKDECKKSPFDNIENGSIIATYKVINDELWEALKENPLSISLEGYFTLNEEKLKYNEENTMNIKDILKRILTNFTETPVGESVWVYDGELTVGTKVTLDNGELVEDGEYEVEGKKIVIKDSIVESVETIEETTEETTETETEETTSEEMEEETETTTEETVEEETTTEETETTSEDKSNDAEIDALKSEIETIKSDIEQIKELINQIAATPAASVATEEFEQIKTDNKNKTATSRMLAYIKK